MMRKRRPDILADQNLARGRCGASQGAGQGGRVCLCEDTGVTEAEKAFTSNI